MNGSISTFFKPSRGIRQGDLLSPYIFILCLEIFSSYITSQVDTLQWDPITIKRNNISFSHLFFADDLTLMEKANEKSCHAIKLGLETFCSLSGQSINHAKSKILFSQNCNPTTIKSITNTLGFKKSESFGTYLGFPILNRNPRPTEFYY